MTAQSPPSTSQDREQLADLLTPDEHRAMDLTAQLADALAVIVGDGPTRAHDLNELAGYVHLIQHAILAQAAARAYPDRYRLLGGPPLTRTKANSA